MKEEVIRGMLPFQSPREGKHALSIPLRLSSSGYSPQENVLASNAVAQDVVLCNLFLFPFLDQQSNCYHFVATEDLETQPGCLRRGCHLSLTHNYISMYFFKCWDLLQDTSSSFSTDYLYVYSYLSNYMHNWIMKTWEKFVAVLKAT